MDPDMPQSSGNKSSVLNVSEYSSQLLSAVMRALKSGSNLPQSGDDFDLYSTFPGFRDFYGQQSGRLTSFINSFLTQQGLRCLPKQEGGQLDVEDRYDRIVEANDMMLEQISTLLESSKTSKQGEASNVEESAATVIQNQTSQMKPLISSWNRQNKHGKKQTFRLFHAQNITRPQNKFQDKIDNSNVPFVPKIREKPNAIKPLPKALIDLNLQDQEGDISLAIVNLVRQGREYGLSDQDIYAHPYETELHELKFLESQVRQVTPQKYDPFPPQPCEVITAKADLLDVVEHLKTCEEFAVDLEAHNYRSFQGITCLMQISSRTKDFLIDVLELRLEMYRMNEVFTDPKIVKVLHGADYDILWLQRDFGVYVVNMFDTGRAARELGLRHFGLDYLLQKYCDVHADKKYQLADWRIRPIPDEMRKYAQEDTHYLLYVHDVMKNELLALGSSEGPHGSETSRLLNVLNKSRELCLKKYEKFLLTPTSHLQFNERRRTQKQLNDRQLDCLRLLFAWRDGMARQEDESVGYVLPKHMLFQIAEIMPREAQGVLACCNPVPPLVHQHVHTIHQLVLEARAKSFDKKTDSARSSEPIQTPVPAKSEVHEYDNLLSCPHDLSHFNTSSKIAVPCGRPTSATSWSSFLSDSYPTRFERSPKLSKLLETHWDPFLKYFNPIQQEDGVARYPKPTKDIETVEDLVLRKMLHPDYAWKLKNLHAETADKSEPKKVLKQPETKEDVIILSQLPQVHGQKRHSQPTKEKKISRHAKKKAKKTNQLPTLRI